MKNRIVDLGFNIVRVIDERDFYPLPEEEKESPKYTLQILSPDGRSKDIVGVKNIQALKGFLEEFLDDLQIIELEEAAEILEREAKNGY